MNRNDLKMSLEQLRNSINIQKNKWINYKDTNCYAYALGIDLPDSMIKDQAYEPGVISNVNNLLGKPFTYEDLLRHIYSDLELLRIDFKEISPNDKVNENEWKIAIYTEYYFTIADKDYLCDFHFLRQRKSGVWYHKTGWKNMPNNLDSNGKIIYNINDCVIDEYDYRKCLCLKLNK